jgi:hypothetical protein
VHLKEERCDPTRYDFCHHTIAVRDQDGFAANGEADIFAKLVFEDLQTD